MTNEIEGRIKSELGNLGYEIDAIETTVKDGRYLSRVRFTRYEEALQFVGKENSAYAEYLRSMGSYKVSVFFVNGRATKSFVAERIGGEKK